MRLGRDAGTMIYGYARRSEDGDDLGAQVGVLRAGGAERIFEEAEAQSGRRRPQLDRMLSQLSKGDVVLIWRLDRLSRSLKDLLFVLERIEQSGAGFRSLAEGVNATGSNGETALHMLRTLAEFERDRIRERTKSGLSSARERGRVGGRRPKLSPDQKRDIAEAVLAGETSGAEMARRHGVSEATISRVVSAYRPEASPADA